MQNSFRTVASGTLSKGRMKEKEERKEKERRRRTRERRRWRRRRRRRRDERKKRRRRQMRRMSDSLRFDVHSNATGQYWKLEFTSIHVYGGIDVRVLHNGFKASFPQLKLFLVF